MAVVTKTTEVCDVCQNPRRQVRKFRLGYDGISVHVVLCGEHSQPVLDLIAIGQRSDAPGPKAHVYTMEEIAELGRRQQRAQKKSPRKRGQEDGVEG